ncbi:MAG TPA: 4Fe-4S binding protein [Syntrophobacteraceae bacterium]|nr:4Fe-4S binding protein [Syntrophobacteraceae bacterium]
MEHEVYKRLANHLDNLPGGFPPTESGVELRILKRFFAPEEAELAVHLTLLPEEPRVVARRAGLPPDETARRLEQMAKKGLILRADRQGSHFKYMAAHYVIGIWEYHVNDLDKDLIQDMHEYIPALQEQAWKVPQLRTVPVGRSVTPQLKVLPYEIAEELVRAQKKFSVGPCICRRERTMMGEGCDRREESCLGFGRAVDYRVRNGISREIDLHETLDILKYADEAGLVVQPANAKDAMFMCLCCGCCCGILKMFKRQARPAAMAASPFFAAHNPESCLNCGRCVDRCQMEALRLEGETVRLDVDRCIGCGLCVSTCPAGSLSLVRKPESRQPEVPRDFVDSAIRLGKARGKITTPGLIKMVVKSKVESLVAMK